MIEEFVEGGFDGVVGEEDVVYEDDGGGVYIDGDVCGGEFFGDGIVVDVVVVEGDVEGVDVSVGEGGGEVLCEGDVVVGDVEEEEFFVVWMVFGDGEGELVDGSVDFRSGEFFG